MRALRERYREVVASVYLYNEARGFRGLERVLEDLKTRFPGEHAFHAQVAKHAADERRHYEMFRRWFESRGRRPLRVGPVFGYVDQLVRLLFRCSPEDLAGSSGSGGDDRFFSVCRLIMMTEARGMKQVDTLLRSPWIREDPGLLRIFRVVARDEPSHTLPYRRWLEARRRRIPGWRERLTDLWVHHSLVWVRIPALFLWIPAPRLPGPAPRALD